MDWSQAIEQERAALLRLVALLHALAGLAERAAFRSPLTRGFVLWILRPAERSAYGFVVGDAEIPTIATFGSTPDDALRLAESLLALACHVDAQARLLGGWENDAPLPALAYRVRQTRDVQAAALLFFSAPRLKYVPDTS